MSQTSGVVLLSILLCVCATPGRRRKSYREQMKGLDEQVQEIKSDVLSIAAELSRLEEKLLYPVEHAGRGLRRAREGRDVAPRRGADPDRRPARRALHLQLQGARGPAEGRRAADLHRQHSRPGSTSSRSRSTASSRAARTSAAPNASRSARASSRSCVGMTLAGPDSGKPAIDVGDWHSAIARASA